MVHPKDGTARRRRRSALAETLLGVSSHKDEPKAVMQVKTWFKQAGGFKTASATDPCEKQQKGMIHQLPKIINVGMVLDLIWAMDAHYRVTLPGGASLNKALAIIRSPLWPFAGSETSLRTACLGALQAGSTKRRRWLGQNWHPAGDTGHRECRSRPNLRRHRWRNRPCYRRMDLMLTPSSSSSLRPRHFGSIWRSIFRVRAAAPVNSISRRVVCRRHTARICVPVGWRPSPAPRRAWSRLKAPRFTRAVQQQEGSK
jgi:hypothetical protein